MIEIKTLLESGGLYMTTLPTGEQFTWRLLTLKEYRVFRGLREAGTYSPHYLYESVFDHCFLGNSDAINGNLPAGYFSAIGELIMHLSGDASLSNERDEIETARMQYPMDSVQETMKRIILIAFPAYTPEAVEEWCRPELLKKFVLAEAVLINKGGYEPIDTKKIMTADQASKKKSSPIDFRRENAEFDQSMGDSLKPHILDQHPDALKSKQGRTNRLQKTQARQLEKAMQRGR
jgi:hypothetical protein